MICGQYKNEPYHDSLKVLPEELSKYLKTTTLIKIELNNIKTNQLIKINIKDYTLQIKNKQYNIAASETNTPTGNFIVIEKWEYPYWRKNDLVYLPSDNNPIGKYLIILADANTLQKVKLSLHTWPLSPYGDNQFIKGNKSKGCIRINKEDIFELFNKIKLGAKINIF
jgi:lipoprotein-anchoring transpeptidase ErfK/SrfK